MADIITDSKDIKVLSVCSVLKTSKVAYSNEEINGIKNNLAVSLAKKIIDSGFIDFETKIPLGTFCSIEQDVHSIIEASIKIFKPKL